MNHAITFNMRKFLVVVSPFWHCNIEEDHGGKLLLRLKTVEFGIVYRTIALISFKCTYVATLYDSLWSVEFCGVPKYWNRVSNKLICCFANQLSKSLHEEKGRRTKNAQLTLT